MRARSATPRPHPFGRAGRTVLQLLEPSTRLLGRHGAHAVVPAYPVPERPAAGPPRPIAGLGGRRRAGLAAPEGRRHRPMVRVHLRHELPLLGRLIALDRRDALGRCSSGRSSMPGARGFRRDASSPGPSRRTMPWPATPVPRGPAPAAIAVAERIAIDQRCQRVRAVGAALPERAIRTPRGERPSLVGSRAAAMGARVRCLAVGGGHPRVYAGPVGRPTRARDAGGPVHDQRARCLRL